MASSFAPLKNNKLAGKIAGVMSCLDDRACYNVVHDDNGYILDKDGNPIAGRAPGGGPFSAVMGVSVGGSLTLVSEPCVNEVLANGIPTQHAEDRSMRPENYKKAIELLTQFKQAGQEAVVWGFSSAEPCPTCLTKFVITASDFIRRGLIKEGNFCVVYGASYDDTLKVAGFNDKLYAKALESFSRAPNSNSHFLRVAAIEENRVPDKVLKRFIRAKEATAYIARDGEIVSTGTDMRSAHDPFSTPEVVAINRACEQLRKKGIQEPWKAPMGELYTTSPIGALAYTSAQWTSIRCINQVDLPLKHQGKQYISEEIQDMNNRALLRLIARGKNNGIVRLVQYSGYDNESQRLWKHAIAVNPKALYNGASPFRYQSARPRTSPEEQYYGIAGTRRYPEFIR